MPLPGTGKRFPSSAGAGGRSEPREQAAAGDLRERSLNEKDHKLRGRLDFQTKQSEKPELEGKRRMEYKIKDLTKDDAEYIGEKISGIVPHEVDADKEEFILRIRDESGRIIGGCIAEAYEYRWSRMFIDTLWVD